MLRSPAQLKKELPLSVEMAGFIARSRKQVQQIYDRRDPRTLVIVGPCSIHNVDEALLFGEKLSKLASEVQESCVLIMRACIEKPRSSRGWMGLVHDPHLNDSADLAHGLFLSRSLFLELTRRQQPIAMEFLTPTLAPYFADLITWGWIGARTSSSQIHRLLASDLPMPIGLKNSCDGNISSAIHGVHVAKHAQVYAQIDEEGRLGVKKSSGNPYAHVILRGSDTETNYDSANVQATLSAMRQLELTPRVVIDCAHGNAQGHYFQQKQVFQNVMQQIAEGNRQVLGMMVESHLEPASQQLSPVVSELQPGVSITDPCLDFASVEELIYALHHSSSTVISST